MKKPDKKKVENIIKWIIIIFFYVVFVSIILRYGLGITPAEWAKIPRLGG